MVLQFVESYHFCLSKLSPEVHSPEPIWSKIGLLWSEKSMLITKKHKRILSREVHLWSRIWQGRGDGLRVEKWDDGNTNNGDGSKGRCRYRLFACNCFEFLLVKYFYFNKSLKRVWIADWNIKASNLDLTELSVKQISSKEYWENRIDILIFKRNVIFL